MKFKEKIKRIPIFGSIIWYFYNFFIAPFKIRKLIEEKEFIANSLQDAIKTLDNLIKIFNEMFNFIQFLNKEGVVDGLNLLKMQMKQVYDYIDMLNKEGVVDGLNLLKMQMKQVYDYIDVLNKEGVVERLNLLQTNMKKFNDDVHKIFHNINTLNNQIGIFEKDLRKLSLNMDMFLQEFDFRFVELEEYKIIDFKSFNINEFKNSTHDFYSLFEKVFRGEDLKQKLEKYVNYIKNSSQLLGRNSIFIDVGCGTGEFLRLLTDNGIKARGIEINHEYVKFLKKRGFDVIFGDGIEYIKNEINDNELLGISAIHVIEHFSFEDIRKFIEIAYQKIKKNGILLIETPNPKCSVALANFYIDYTHVRPCPFELIYFLFEYSGFEDIKLIMSSPVQRNFRTGNPLGDYMDYAILGFKRR